jgi:hypothetical protein
VVVATVAATTKVAEAAVTANFFIEGIDVLKNLLHCTRQTVFDNAIIKSTSTSSLLHAVGYGFDDLM